MRSMLFCFFLLLFNCEDKKTTPKSIETNPQTSAIKDTMQPKVNMVKEIPDTTVLTEENAMDFFLEYEKEHLENKVRLITDFGEIDILLYSKTKFHRANFIYLTKQGYFDNTQFYRVINNFMIQGGNTDDPKVKRKRRIIGKYLLPKDTKRGYTHERGSISMPSSDIENPHKLASPYEFFIIQNPKGEARLDGDYTIFGKVIRGMDVVDKIAAVATDKAHWPLKNVYIQKAKILE